jgi:alginate O-acetyltransferase complex protein AlgI
MLFCSLHFLFFFSAIFLVYWIMPWREARIWLLLGASFYFYASWNAWLALLIGVTAAMDYVLALGMDRTDSSARRKLLLGISLTVNLGVLGYFKYANFFLDSLTQTLHALGASASMPLLQVILPIGISFYTFEAINYTVDVYRHKIPAERNLAHFLLFILFFPHLIAGPIVRAKDFLPQIKRRKRWSWPRLHLGAQLFLLGMVKKLAVADRLALYVDPVFAHPERYGSHVAWLAMLGYALQVYCDFSGYSDMALGAAHALGYKLVKNFDLPYLSANIAEFWNRWHISLSSWLRDYLFIPLGGSRGGFWKTSRNLLVTFTLCGLWHGAGWPFVCFGFLQGLLLIGHRAFRRWCQTVPRLDALLRTPSGTALRIVVTFVSFCLSLVVFRAESLKGAGQMFGRLWDSPAEALTGPLSSISIVTPLILAIVCHLLSRRGLWPRWQARLPASALGLSYACALVLSLMLAPSGSKPFIYFQF